MVDEGEHVRQDFKFAISDARKIARSISAFANNCGGRLLIGVKDNGVIAGVRNEEDIYVVEQAAERYCHPPQQISFKAYRHEGTHTVIVAETAPAVRKPVYVLEADGRRRAYYRVADENIAADPLMVRAWQLAASGTSGQLGDRHYALLALFDAEHTLTPARIATLLHISHATAATLVVELAAAKLLTFVHTGDNFVLTQASPPFTEL